VLDDERAIRRNCMVVGAGGRKRAQQHFVANG
jgi:hypothetical protein